MWCKIGLHKWRCERFGTIAHLECVHCKKTSAYSRFMTLLTCFLFGHTFIEHENSGFAVCWSCGKITV